MKKGNVFYISIFNLNKHDFIKIKCLYRIDPIPGSSNGRKTYLYFRCPKTTQEKRMCFACDKKYIRSKRSKKYLPSSWDDMIRSDYYNKRDWKKNKIKKQWMKHL